MNASSGTVTDDRAPVLRALREAIGRLNKAGVDHARSFAPIGEVLFWVVAADDRVKRSRDAADLLWRSQSGAAPLLDGLRHARNNYAHDLIVWRQRSADIVADRVWGSLSEWVWVEPPLPPPMEEEALAGRLHQHRAFMERLHGRSVRDTVADAHDDLAQHWGLPTLAEAWRPDALERS